MNYLIPEANGFQMTQGQIVKVAELQITPSSTDSVDVFVDSKTQVVENGTSKVLPFSSKKLIINSTL
jgi:hypothetical protein